MLPAELKPLVVECNSCHKSAETWDFRHPDLAVECGCCPIAHDHAGLGCRTVTVTATAHLSIFSLDELLAMAAEKEWDRQFEEVAP
jgi:hypothetical protein